METTQVLEAIVEKYGADVVEFSLQPSLLIILTTSFFRQQAQRTPGAPVSFDSTYNLTTDGLKLSMFVVSALSLEFRYVPFLACIHRAMDADVYRRIFIKFFSLFGRFGAQPVGFSGVTTDFADAIRVGYLRAWEEHAIASGVQSDMRWLSS